MKFFKKKCPKCNKKMTYSNAPTTGWICTEECSYTIDDNGTEWYKGNKI